MDTVFRGVEAGSGLPTPSGAGWAVGNSSSREGASPGLHRSEENTKGSASPRSPVLFILLLFTVSYSFFSKSLFCCLRNASSPSVWQSCSTMRERAMSSCLEASGVPPPQQFFGLCKSSVPSCMCIWSEALWAKPCFHTARQDSLAMRSEAQQREGRRYVNSYRR